MQENISPPNRTQSRKPVSAWWILAGLLTLLFLSQLMLGALSGAGNSLGAPVGIVTLDGPISDSNSRSLLGGRSVGARGFIENLDSAATDPTIKAVVIRISSPGGSAAASQEMYGAVRRLRAKKPVFCSMGDVAASGGYYIAAGCNQIYANPSTVTGSIGVISQYLNYEALFRKVGLNQTTIKSGPFKDAGSPTRPLTAAEKKLFQSINLSIYHQFVNDVVDGRRKATAGKLTRSKVLRLADGRIYTGQQAKANGLIDNLGGLYETVQAAGRAVGVEGTVPSRDIDHGGGGGLLSLIGASMSEAAGRSFGDAVAAGAIQRFQAESGAASAPLLR